MDALPYPVLCKDAQGAYLAVNDAYESRFGVQRAQLLGRSLLQTRHIDVDWEQAHQAHLRVLSSRAAERDERVLPAIGGERLCRIHRIPVQLPNGQAALLVVIADMEEARAPQWQDNGIGLKQAANWDANLLSLMSHEIRTPMSGLLGTLELLDHPHLSERQRMLLRVAGEAARSLLHVIDDVLDYARIEAGRLAIACKPFNLRQVIDNVVRARLSQATINGARIDARIDSDVATYLKGDGERLRHLLDDLLRYALKFTFDGDVRVEVRVIEEADGRQDIEIGVAGAGGEMGAEHWAALFDPSAEAAGSIDRSGAADGLELVIAHRLCSLMDLSIGHQSEPDQSARIMLRGRFVMAGAAEREDASFAITPDSGSTKLSEELRILVAEDHAIVREVLHRQLETLGWLCDVVADGEEALAALSARSYALLITDCHMPKMDGFELARRIRAGEMGSRLPIIALTANVLVDQERRCIEAGMDDMMAKPLRLATLADKLNHWIGRSMLSASVVSDAISDETDGSDIAQVKTCLSKVFGDSYVAVLKDYVELTQSERERLNAALRVMDIDKVREVAHSVRGIAAFFGASQLAEVASSVESDQPTSDMLMRARQLESDLGGFMSALKQSQQT
ncbi:response regulator [Dyella koreensis]|uniref:histidine kinase n=1 Tax=Dyella koreensis TaxID=311235 RepID=A0ABW8KA59_9GAMM